jgi:hypothetical protein
MALVEEVVYKEILNINKLNLLINSNKFMNKKITKYCLFVLILILVGSVSFIQFVGAENMVVVATKTVSPTMSLISSNVNNISSKGVENSGADDNIKLTASFLGDLFGAIADIIKTVVETVIEVVETVVETVVEVVQSVFKPSKPSSQSSFPTPAASPSGGRCVFVDSCGVNSCTTDDDCVTGNGGNGGGGGSSLPWNPPTWNPPTGSAPPFVQTELCMINYFELPERAWVGYPIIGKWSAGAWCDNCDVSCTPYPECTWEQDSIGIGFDEHEFTLLQPGIYNYTLSCYGQGGTDKKTESATVEALNLPWWQEINPVLPED